jgi:hypothetical protein
MKKPTAERLDWRTLFKPKDDLPPETIKVFDEYFSCFAQPPMKVDEDGKNNVGDQPCLKCGEPLTGGLKNFLLGKGGFTWGLAHGEGFCANCKWPARAHHFIKDADGKGDLMTIHNLVLQYHPDFVEVRKRA